MEGYPELYGSLNVITRVLVREKQEITVDSRCDDRSRGQSDGTRGLS